MAQVQSPGKTSAHSPGKKCSPGFSEKDNIKKLSDLADKLAEIRKQKESLKAVNAYTKTKGDAPIIGDYSTRPKKLFNHPKLEHVYGQIVFSPYNFSPMQKYPHEIHTMPQQLIELRAREVQAATLRKGEPKPNLDLPFDLKKVKNEFIKIVNYKSTFGKDYENMYYESDYGVKATSRIVKPGSTLEQMGELTAEKQKRKEQKDQLHDARKQFNVTRSLQYLCSLQSGGAAKFREKVDHVKRVASPEKVSRNNTASSNSKSMSHINTSSTTSSSSTLAASVEYNMELDPIENDILKNLKADEVKRELMRTFDAERDKPKSIKKQKSTPQLYRRLSRLPSMKDNLLPSIAASAMSTRPSSPGSESQNEIQNQSLLTQLNVGIDMGGSGSSKTRNSSVRIDEHENVMYGDEDFVVEEEEAKDQQTKTPGTFTPKSAAANGSPAAKAGSPVGSPVVVRSKTARSPKSNPMGKPIPKPKSAAVTATATATATSSLSKKPSSASNVKHVAAEAERGMTAPAAVCEPTYRKVEASTAVDPDADSDYADDFADSSAAASVKDNGQKPTFVKNDEPDYADDFADSSAADAIQAPPPAAFNQVAAEGKDDVDVGDYDVDFEEDSAVDITCAGAGAAMADRGSVAGFGSTVVDEEEEIAEEEPPRKNNTTISVSSTSKSGSSVAAEDSLYGDDFDH